MSVSQGWSLQQAVVGRLESQLAGQGPGGADVAVYSYAPSSHARVFARIEGFNIVQRGVKADKTRHFFSVTIYDKPTTEGAGSRGNATAKQVLQKAVAALHRWKPGFSGATAIRHVGSGPVDPGDPLAAAEGARFSVFL